jgi:hypothetical protein
VPGSVTPAGGVVWSVDMRGSLFHPSPTALLHVGARHGTSPG